MKAGVGSSKDGVNVGLLGSAAIQERGSRLTLAMLSQQLL